MTEPHAAEDPAIELTVRAAAKGERWALAELYGQGAAWLESGRCPPPLLRDWLAAVMRDLHSVARAHLDKDASEEVVTKQLRAATRFKRAPGRPTSRRSEVQERMTAGDVFHAMTFDGAQSLEHAIEMVQEYQRRMRLPPASEKQIEAAWTRFRKELPELRRLKPKG